MLQRRVYRTLMVMFLGASALWSVNASLAALPECVTSGLTQGVIGERVVDNQTYYVRRLATILDPALNDFGISGGSDHLEVFCVSITSADLYGQIAMCLSNESCPWR